MIITLLLGCMDSVEWNAGMEWNRMDWPDAHLEGVVKDF